jgi:hypothetical protein
MRMGLAVSRAVLVQRSLRLMGLLERRLVARRVVWLTGLRLRLSLIGMQQHVRKEG